VTKQSKKQFDPSTSFFSLLVPLSILIFSYIHFLYFLYSSFLKQHQFQLKKSTLTTKRLEKTLKTTQICQEHILKKNTSKKDQNLVATKMTSFFNIKITKYWCDLG
jgi:hypothetical protein